MKKKKKRIRIHCLKWVLVDVCAALVILEATAGHYKWTVWAYITFGFIATWIAASIIGLVKGWFY